MQLFIIYLDEAQIQTRSTRRFKRDSLANQGRLLCCKARRRELIRKKQKICTLPDAGFSNIESIIHFWISRGKVANKIQMLEEGVGKRIQMLLRSEMPPVQFKLLGTLRMLIDGQAEAAEEMGQDPTLLNRLAQWCGSKDHAGVCGEANRLLASLLRHSRSPEVVKAIQEAQGVKHLVSMATSEHVIMQNEALIALAIASAISLENIKEAFKEAQLVQNIHKLLQSESTGPEVKYNAIGLLCSLLSSAELREEAEEDQLTSTLEALCGHSNDNVAKQALMALQILNEEPSLLGP